MANQYSKLTKDNVLRKINRKRSPATSLVQLAREFGVRTDYTRSDWDLHGRGGETVSAAPPAFRKKVRDLVGTKVYKQITSR